MGTSLPDAFAAIPGYRNASGQRKSRPAILTLAVCAMLSGARSAYAIHKWGCCQSPGTVRAMGSPTPKSRRCPACTGCSAAWGWRPSGLRWFAGARHPWAVDRQAVAVDGKALRGIHGKAPPGVRLLAGYARPALNRAGL